MDSPVLLRFAQLSDSHVLAGGRPYRGVPCGNVLVRAVGALSSSLDFVVHTGDLIARPAARDAYRWYADVIRSVSLPVHHVPGNHDDTSLMRECVPGCDHDYPWSFDIRGVRAIGLDSSSGVVSAGQLDVLRGKLEECERCLVFVHHQVCYMSGSWMNRFALENTDQLFGALFPYASRILGLFHGHIHYHAEFNCAPFRVFSAPSLSTTFAPFGRHLEMGPPDPAFCEFAVHEDGSVLETRVPLELE